MCYQILWINCCIFIGTSHLWGSYLLEFTRSHAILLVKLAHKFIIFVYWIWFAITPIPFYILFHIYALLWWVSEMVNLNTLSDLLLREIMQRDVGAKLWYWVSGFATDSSCDVWCRGLTTCLLHVGPPFGNRFLNTSWAVGLTYWIVYLHFFVFWHMQLYMSWYILSFFGFIFTS